MVKKRRVVVISPYQFNKRGICTVVPLSTTTPQSIEVFHYKISAGNYRFLSQFDDTWVKTDMLATVSLRRLDRIRVDQHFLAPSLNEHDIKQIKQSVRNFLDLQ